MKQLRAGVVQMPQAGVKQGYSSVPRLFIRLLYFPSIHDSYPFHLLIPHMNPYAQWLKRGPGIERGMDDRILKL